MSRNNSKRNRHQNKLRNARLILSGETGRVLATATPPPPSAQPLAPATAPSSADTSSPAYQNQPPPLRGGRQTQPTNVNPLGMLAYSFLPRRQYQDFDLTDLTSLGRHISSQQMLEMFADLSPEVSLALWNTVQLVNTGYSYQVKTKDGKRDLSRAKGVVDELIDGLNKDGGGIDAIIDSWTITAFLQGAVSGELALSEDLQDVQDLYAVQPWSIHFERDGAQNLVPFQQQVASATGLGGNGFGVAGYPFKRLNPVTFGYIPIHATPDDPYGRPPAAPVLQLIAFDLQLLKDIRQAVHVNAWGRIDIQIVEEILLKNAPPFTQDPTGQRKRDWVATQIRSFSDAYAGIKPDDAFIHSDAVKVTTIDSSGKTFQVDAIVRMLERRLIRALKQLPVLMGSNEGTTETHGSVQMDIYAAGIKSLQKTIANLLEKLLGVALQVHGISAKVIWEFEPVRATDRLQDAQSDQLEGQVAAYQRDQGWITQDEASIKITGSEAVAEPKPMTAPPPVVPPVAPDANNTNKKKDKNQSDNKPDPKAADVTDETNQDQEGNKAA